MSRKITLYDTTLRDGAQMRGIAFSVQDKLRIARELDAFGVDFIEAGWPAANPKDEEFFQKIKYEKLKHAEIVAFGSTHRPGLPPGRDPAFKALLSCEPRAVAIVAKSWRLHATDVLKVSPEENIKLIRNTVAFFKKRAIRVFLDAEHFFDGWAEDVGYALECVRAAADSGADTVVLCDTNGGSLPWRIEEAAAAAHEVAGIPIGIHAHNDGGMAVANTLAAVRAGASQVQVTMNGYGERCGNADLCAVVPNLSLKMGCVTVPKKNLADLARLAAFVSELANRPLPANRPFVGSAAFTHKAGIHVDAVRKNPRTYEHVPPEAVGNRRGVLVSDQAGKANVLHAAERMGIDLGKDPAAVRAVLDELKRAEFKGYKYEGAEGSFEILVRKSTGAFQPYFKLDGLRVIVTKRKRTGGIFCEATIQVRMGETVEHTAAEGDGPVNALDNALRKALEPMYPCLSKVRLTDYKVRVLDERDGTAAGVRVLITSSDGKAAWSTVGVSTNVIEASWLALVDSIEYKLLKEKVAQK